MRNAGRQQTDRRHLVRQLQPEEQLQLSIRRVIEEAAQQVQDPSNRPKVNAMCALMGWPKPGAELSAWRRARGIHEPAGWAEQYEAKYAKFDAKHDAKHDAKGDAKHETVHTSAHHEKPLPIAP